MKVYFDPILGRLRVNENAASIASINANLTILNNNEYKVTYFEIVSGTSGTITLPTGATINANEFGDSGDSVLSKINADNKPNWESPKTAGGTVVTANLNTLTGAWTASGTYVDAQVALIYSLKIKEYDLSNLNYNNIIGSFEYMNNGMSYSSPLSYTPSTNTVAITQATNIQDGYLSSTDWNTFNNKGTIKGAIAASNRIAFGNGSANTLTDSANITYNGTTLALLGNLSVATTGVPVAINSTNSNINKLQFTDNGTSRGYLGASSLYCFTAYESTGATMRVGVTSAGNLLVGPTSSGGTDIVGEFLRTVASTSQVRLTNASASNGAYVQYTLINNAGAAGVVNLGLVGGGTTTSGVYVQNQAYNMTTSGGWSFGTLNAAGVVRVYGGNGVLSFTVDASSNIEIADTKNIIFNTSTGTKIGTATGQKFAFWNKTPIIQPTTGITGATLTGGGGTTITSTDTFGGYTLQQLAAIIINTGLAA